MRVTLDLTKLRDDGRITQAEFDKLSQLATHWFERLGATPGAVVAAGLVTLGFAFGIWSLNRGWREPV